MRRYVPTAFEADRHGGTPCSRDSARRSRRTGSRSRSREAVRTAPSRGPSDPAAVHARIEVHGDVGGPAIGRTLAVRAAVGVADDPLGCLGDEPAPGRGHARGNSGGIGHGLLERGNRLEYVGRVDRRAGRSIGERRRPDANGERWRCRRQHAMEDTGPSPRDPVTDRPQRGAALTAPRCFVCPGSAGAVPLRRLPWISLSSR